MLIVVKNRNLHPLAEFLLHHKAFWRLDIFKVNAAKGRLQRGDDINQLIDIGLVDFNIKDIDIGKFLKQYRLAFHYRLRRQWANIAQTQHSSTVGNNRHEVASGCDRGHFGRILDNQFTGMGNTGRVGEG